MTDGGNHVTNGRAHGKRMCWVLLPGNFERLQWPREGVEVRTCARAPKLTLEQSLDGFRWFRMEVLGEASEVASSERIQMRQKTTMARFTEDQVRAGLA